mgnify:FL=1
MAIGPCVKCGRECTYCMFGYCAECFGKQFKCKICGEAMSSYINAMRVHVERYLHGWPKDPTTVSAICIDCSAQGERILKKFR